RYRNGEGVARDYVQAYKWLHFATYDAFDREDDARERRYAVVRDRVSATLTPAQIVEALRLAEEHACENRDVAEGMYDWPEAVRVCRRAAEKGNAAAQYKLGHLYHYARENYGAYGVQDYAEAVTWYRKAAEQGNALAQANLGAMYYNGQGVMQDYM